MFEMSKVLVIIRADDHDRYESISRDHGSDPSVRVILDRRRPESHPRPKAAARETHPPERRSTRAQNWKDGQLIVETGFPQ